MSIQFLENQGALYAISFFAAFLLALFLSLAVMALARKFGILDKPGVDRKIHKKPVPLLGGLAIFLSYFSVLYLVGSQLVAGDLNARHWIGFFLGAAFLIVGGILDDKYDLPPKWQIIWPVLAGLAVIAGGVSIDRLSNPFGSEFQLDSLAIPVFSLGGQVYTFMVVSDILILLWLLGMMYTTKLLDGLDGLVTGMTAIGGFIIFLFTMTTKYYQPDIGLAALVLAGSCLGFLVFNWHPAKIFLGEGGSLLLGFILGVLAIISGGKIAIALLIMGIPVLDVAWTIIRRVRAGKNPFKFADRKHLHFRLFDLGFGHRKTVLIFYFFATLFGLSALFLQSLGKLLALIFLLVLMFTIIVVLNTMERRLK